LPEPTASGVDGRQYVRLVPTDGGLRAAVARVAPWNGRQARAVIAPSVVGVCRSDLRELAGVRAIRHDFGHEIVARVVTAEPAALRGLVEAAVCLDPHVDVTRTSGFGELIEIIAPVETVALALRPLPAPLANKLGIFVEPMACASHCVARALASPALPGDARGRAAVVGAGIAGTLIALGLEAAGLEVDVFNRSPARLDVLRERGVFPSTVLYRLATAERRYRTVVVATAELTHEALQWTFDAVVDGGTIMLYAGTTPGVPVGGLDVDSIRRGEHRVAVEHADRTVHLVGTHGAIAADFDRATDLLQRDGDNALRMRLARLLGPELTLHEALVELPRHVHSGFVGKAYVRLRDESSAN
jgi:cyclitol reductase